MRSSSTLLRVLLVGWPCCGSVTTALLECAGADMGAESPQLTLAGKPCHSLISSAGLCVGVLEFCKLVDRK
jgi:hypothetical protein